MAIHAHSTIAPIVQPRLLRGGGTVPCRVLTTDELLDEIRLTIEEQVLGQLDAKPELAPEPLLLAFHGDTRTDIGSVDRCSYPDHIGVAEGQPEMIRLDSARAFHFRRELQQALDHGFALLDALDLPPLGIDVIDDAIATLDALDAPDEDLEPYLAGYYNGASDPTCEGEFSDGDDEDDGTAEAEPDDEDGGDLEAVDEDGDPLDLGERDGWRRPRRARVANTEWPVAMAEREGQRAVVIAAVVTSPNVVRFPGSGPL